jgi:DNA repair exonuclease SbcCD ATPase subunit
MRQVRPLAIVLLVILVPAMILAGCLGGGSPEAKEKVDEAIGIIASSQILLEDLVNLNERFNTLGTRYSNVDDTLAEGKSLVEMALMDVSELETRYQEARDLLLDVTKMDGAGDYAAYALLALQAVDKELESLEVNRQLLNTVSDMLDVLPHAEREEQLSYYVEEINRLTEEITKLMEEAAVVAAEADRYYQEHRL